MIQGDPKKTEPNSNYSKYTGPVFFGSPCSYVTKELCVLVTLFRAEIGLLTLSSGSDSGCRVGAEKTRPRPTLGSGFNYRAGQIGHRFV